MIDEDDMLEIVVDIDKLLMGVQRDPLNIVRLIILMDRMPEDEKMRLFNGLKKHRTERSVSWGFKR